MNTSYNAQSIQVLSGLDPVRKRPGMYTDTSRPNHLAQEVIDNSVDEALAGFATQIRVTLHQDHSLSVQDNGRGMPIDIHPEHGVSGVELILTRLHAGGKFSNQHYQFSGGLHGVGVSVVNALSARLQVEIKRDGGHYQIAFAHGEKTQELTQIAQIGARTRGTLVRFWPDPQYFDYANFSVARLQHVLKAKAVLCSGLQVSFHDETTGEEVHWCYQQGLIDYLKQSLYSASSYCPDPVFSGQFATENEQLDWALTWLVEGGEGLNESYVNLIPTAQGGTHVNGLRTGLLEAMREFCDLKNLLPRGLKLAPEDVWDTCTYILSVKWPEPQFAGQTKERLASRQCAAFVTGVIKDAFSLWLNQHPEIALTLAEWMIQRAQQRTRASKKVLRKRVSAGPALPGKLADCTSQDPRLGELFLVEGDSAGGSAKQARDREYQAILPLRGKILNTWEVDAHQVLASQEVHDIAVALGIDPANSDLSGLRYHKVCILADADSDGMHIATLLCALFVRHFPALVQQGHLFVALPPLYRVDVGKEVHYALDENELEALLAHLSKTHPKTSAQVTRFKGLGEMNPMQLRETTMAPDTRRLLQLTLDNTQETERFLDMLLARKRSLDRRHWLSQQGQV
ncbi:topoisomerase-4 subunit B [Allopseudospirillum japonicum]|uniref:DNA topoisomerase 4 subunit B n=1 Tax=Allopseudospirillum japonicum TaxID=64971 RepID=A0A1H6QR58_9GAMM|nr:DNA topoisomerase IV subunit B [Allopseudospirillum japonicum]SEI41462.1 topoisomerase-4 subunit B [Allopseudospirillum japonicum]